MRKKFLLFTVLLAIIACIFAISVSAETPSTYIEFSARFEGSDEYITVYTENAGDSSEPKINFTKAFYSDVEFTNTVDMTNVTGIDFSEAYSNNTDNNVSPVVKSSTAFTKCVEVKWFSENATTTSVNLFDGWTSLKSFDFGCAEVIDRYAFRKTAFEELVIPSTVSEIGNYAFRSCTSLKSVDFEGDINFGSDVFRDCSSLATICIDNLSIIGKSMFYNCDALTSVTIPDTVSNIGDTAFNGCDGITSVTFEEGFQGVIGEGAFKNTKALANVNLCEGITVISNDCFYGAGAIGKVVLPDSVTTLGENAFYNSSLSEIVISENSQLAVINEKAFSGCKSLKSIYIPSGVKIVATSLFANCTNLEAVHNFENVVFASEKGENVFVGTTFQSCSKLKEIILPLTTVKIEGTITQLTALEKLYIPAYVQSISTTYANNIPKECTIFYCGGDANKLLSMTANSSGVTSTLIKGKITNDMTVKYTDADADYPNGYIVYEANSCDLFYNGEHIESLEYDFTFIDENGYATTEKYVSNFKVSYQCTRNCGKEVIVEILPAMFTFNGYSMPEDGRNELTVGYLINNKSISKYEEYTNTTLDVGIFAAAKKQIADGDVFNENGEANSGVSKIELKNETFFSFDFKLSGFTTDAHKEALLAIGVYVFEDNSTDKELTYIQASKPLANDKYSFISFNQFLNV